MSTASISHPSPQRGTLGVVQRWYGIEQVPALPGSVVTIGNFDGVHLGHQAVLAQVTATAAQLQVPAVALTFDPHPATVHRPGQAPELLTGLQDRLELLAATGIDATLVIPYTLDFAQFSAEEFVRRYLVEALRVRTVVVGQDVRFGAGNSGDRNTMRELARRWGFEVRLVADAAEDGRPRWSSTGVRKLLAAGDAEGARAALGRWHHMRGRVVHGEARGRALGFPTANLAAEATGTIPADGIYAGWLQCQGPEGPERMPAAISIGTNPTFQGHLRQVEAHVLGRDDLDLYGDEVRVEFVSRLRPTLEFAGVEELVTQMRHDVLEAARVLGVPAPSMLPTTNAG
ncbi:MAG TPA: bifunctional riboflavin kinase/FAD synthetase [Ruania sp.]|nr:bifunctional riboflavin kinase/FAD synthetase [Ruania sp.]